MFAESTKQTYRTHLGSFLRFCIMHDLPAVPASISTVTRYAAYLARSKCYSSVNQYLNTVRIIHLEFGLPNPLQDNWTIQSVLKGIKRGKGTTSISKSPVLPSHLLLMHRKLNLNTLNDKLIWAALLCGFFGMLRVSNVCGQYAVLRKDLRLTGQGFVLSIHRSKTIQHGERTHQMVLPFMKGHVLCPVTAILNFMTSASAPINAPLFSFLNQQGSLTCLTPAKLRSRLKYLCDACPGLDYCSTHSLRKGMATWLLMCKIPLATIKILGDWSSDAVLQYLLPDFEARFTVMKSVAAAISKWSDCLGDQILFMKFFFATSLIMMPSSLYSYYYSTYGLGGFTLVNE